MQMYHRFIFICFCVVWTDLWFSKNCSWMSQVSAYCLRPHKDAKIRKYWNWYHHWVGRLLLFLAAVNIVLGIQIGGAGNIWKVGYGVVLSVILVTVAVLSQMVQMKGWAFTLTARREFVSLRIHGIIHNWRPPCLLSFPGCEKLWVDLLQMSALKYNMDHSKGKAMAGGQKKSAL